METFQNLFSLLNSVVHASNKPPSMKMTENLDISDQNYDIAYRKIKNTYDNAWIRATFH